jgi:Zn-dependent metalloprotease
VAYIHRNMMRNVLRLAVLGLTSASLISACADDPTPQTIETYSLDNARIVRSESGVLTPATSGTRQQIVRDYLRDRAGAAVDQLQIVNEVPARNGVTHVRLEQQVGGLRVYGAYVKAAISDRGELIQLIEKVAPLGAIAKASASERDALSATFAELGYEVAVPGQSKTLGNTTTYARDAVFHSAPSIERVAYVDGRSLREGFLVETWSVKGNQLDYTLIGSDGKVVSTERRTANDSYNVFVEDPAKGAQTVVAGGANWLGAGAQTTHNISGNNANAYLDTDANNAPDSGGTAVTDGNFLTTADLTTSPATDSNRNVAVQNLFYFNNTVHDILYSHGFTEAAGNFQIDNFGNGGLGSDPVQAEAQDGSGLDNANFSTPNDGQKPRMQMYLWSGPEGDAFVTVGGSDTHAFSSSFGAAVTATGIAGPLAVVNDGVGTTSDGCEASPAGSLTGKVAVVDRGTCNFTVKVLNAQNAGAVAVLIANNAPGGAFSPGGTERKVKISSAMVSQADGATLKGQVGISARLRSNPSPLRLDGDVDADIVYHEYGHGLTWRMIGGMSGPIAGAIGEGASDTNAFLINGDDIVGEYSFANPLGIRSQPYSTYVGSYATSVTGTEVHADGELYAAIMWRVKENYLAAGLTISDVQDDWVDGFNFTASTPAYETMRDGMLQGAASDRACLIWEGYAHFGVGVGASGKVTRGGHAISITESFAKPATCP